jgi:hypothetical protein
VTEIPMSTPAIIVCETTTPLFKVGLTNYLNEH